MALRSGLSWSLEGMTDVQLSRVPASPRGCEPSMNLPWPVASAPHRVMLPRPSIPAPSLCSHVCAIEVHVLSDR